MHSIPDIFYYSTFCRDWFAAKFTLYSNQPESNHFYTWIDYSMGLAVRQNLIFNYVLVPFPNQFNYNTTIIAKIKQLIELETKFYNYFEEWSRPFSHSNNLHRPPSTVQVRIPKSPSWTGPANTHGKNCLVAWNR